MAKDTTACMANPTLSGRGRKIQMTAAAARMRKMRYWATATITLFMSMKARMRFWENRMNTPRRPLSAGPTADARKSQCVTTPPFKEGR
jgi:hypothetical protein